MAQMGRAIVTGRVELSNGISAHVRLENISLPNPATGLSDDGATLGEMRLRLIADPVILPIERMMALAVLAGDRAAAMALADRLLASLHGGGD